MVGVVRLGDVLDGIDEALTDHFHLTVEVRVFPTGGQPKDHLVIFDVFKAEAVATTCGGVCLLDLWLRNEGYHPVNLILEGK